MTPGDVSIREFRSHVSFCDSRPGTRYFKNLPGLKRQGLPGPRRGRGSAAPRRTPFLDLSQERGSRGAGLPSRRRPQPQQHQETKQEQKKKTNQQQHQQQTPTTHEKEDQRPKEKTKTRSKRTKNEQRRQGEMQEAQSKQDVTKTTTSSMTNHHHDDHPPSAERPLSRTTSV